MLELAKNPAIQRRLREEIRAMEQAIHARGGSHFTAADLDNMPYLAAVIKVCVFTPGPTHILDFE